ncbi:hypothetical protein BVRB_015230 [Beta vulgaris subsp. vulgaris]|uniref:Uncharacterized protein n=1 Tax=Beta vulgaris subsp. vulgaris TaxID=3555 RepID=A0A0J8DVC3_BETVV|nr:hypothetical protein BVRB_015230 [Beta vulgaris subsp. vulgaris]
MSSKMLTKDGCIIVDSTFHQHYASRNLNMTKPAI